VLATARTLAKEVTSISIEEGVLFLYYITANTTTGGAKGRRFGVK